MDEDLDICPMYKSTLLLVHGKWTVDLQEDAACDGVKCGMWSICNPPGSEEED